eukprot:TRINITY_DN5853_c0_g2_i1.p1 TRINITY_DN5853_c0_g2~~TRINITY_DN5853_c0_g2_i1.p1  ORF type:complete len:907 (+),score=99.57 TRINITY_DN5853_c0_g2_i1:188-2722(+)
MTNPNFPEPHVIYRRNFAELESLAPFWSKDYKSKVVERQGLDPPLLAQYQRQTVRYSVCGSLEEGGKLDGSASHQGWSRVLSEQCYEQLTLQQYQLARGGSRGGYDFGKAVPPAGGWERLPHYIRMEITQAPAEFACPVKQDKRLSPDFKVKVTIKYAPGQEVYLPVSMKAIVIPADQYSQMCSWIPPELGSEDKQLSSFHDKKFQVPLKGTDTVHHTFSSENLRQYAHGHQHHQHHLQPHSIPHSQGHPSFSSVANAHRQRLNNPYLSLPPHSAATSQYHHMSQQQQQQSPLSPQSISEYRTNGSGASTTLGGGGGGGGNMQQQQLMASFYDASELDYHHYTRQQENAAVQNLLAMSRDQPQQSQQYYNQSLMEELNQIGEQGGGYYEQSAQSNGGQAYRQSSTGMQQQQQQQSMGMGEKQAISSQSLARKVQEQLQAFQRGPSSNGGVSSSATNTYIVSSGALVPKEEMSEMAEMSHEFVFSNLEFQKPSRMSKVYLVFYFTVQGIDLVYAMFKIPTICICRAEQRYRAYGMLGIPCYAKSKKDSSSPDIKLTESNITVMRGGQQLQERELWEIAVALEHDGSRSGNQGALQQTNSISQQHSPQYHQHQMLEEQSRSADFVNSGSLEINGTILHQQDITQQEQQGLVSGEDIWEWAYDRYNQLGLQRPLIRYDKEGILKMAALLSGSNYITKQNFEQFQNEFNRILSVVFKLSKYWNCEGCISNFGVGSEEALNILTEESPGTCIIRMAQTSMGSLSVTIVKAMHDENRRMKQVRHYLMSYEQIMRLPNGNLDQWFQSIGVEFIMDPTTKKKIPREKLVTNYTKLEDLLNEMHQMDQPVASA